MARRNRPIPASLASPISVEASLAQIRNAPNNKGNNNNNHKALILRVSSFPQTLDILTLALWLPTCLTACTSVDRAFPWEKDKGEADKKWAQSTERPFKTPTLKPPKNRYFSLPGHGKVVAMTFDDGPRPWTMDLLDALKERNIKATFFVVGRVVKTYPDVIKRIAAEGHELANHTWSHPRNMARMPQRVVRRELELCRDAIVEVAGVKPRVFRPPGGSFTKDQSAWIYDEFDYVNIMWSVDP